TNFSPTGSRARSTWAGAARTCLPRSSAACARSTTVAFLRRPSAFGSTRRGAGLMSIARRGLRGGGGADVGRCRVGGVLRRGRTDVRLGLGPGATLMSAADVFGLVVSLAVLVYLVYALFRGERL